MFTISAEPFGGKQWHAVRHAGRLCPSKFIEETLFDGRVLVRGSHLEPVFLAERHDELHDGESISNVEWHCATRRMCPWKSVTREVPSEVVRDMRRRYALHGRIR